MKHDTFKLPKGARWLLAGEKIKSTDVFVSAFDDEITSAARWNGDKYLGHTPCYRPAAAPRKHRFDGMTLGQVLIELSEDVMCRYSEQRTAIAFAREVRRRDKMRGAK